MEEVSLQEMLAARERRCYLQTQLLHQYKKSLISFTLNIPGPVKVLTDVPEAFASGCQRIETLIKRPSGSYSAYGIHKGKNRI